MQGVGTASKEATPQRQKEGKLLEKVTARPRDPASDHGKIPSHMGQADIGAFRFRQRAPAEEGDGEAGSVERVGHVEGPRFIAAANVPET